MQRTHSQASDAAAKGQLLLDYIGYLEIEGAVFKFG